MSKSEMASEQEAEWVTVLRGEVGRTSQRQVAKRLGVSAASISLVLSGQYPASTEALEQRVRGELMSECVECPVLGEIDRRWCLDWQQKPFAATNPMRVKVWRACRSGCPNSRLVQQFGKEERNDGTDGAIGR